MRHLLTDAVLLVAVVATLIQSSASSWMVTASTTAIASAGNDGLPTGWGVKRACANPRIFTHGQCVRFARQCAEQFDLPIVWKNGCCMRGPKPRPTMVPTSKGTRPPHTRRPTMKRTKKPTMAPTPKETHKTRRPTMKHTKKPTMAPTSKGTRPPHTRRPTMKHTKKPTMAPTSKGTRPPHTRRPTMKHTKKPTMAPTPKKTRAPHTKRPTLHPTMHVTTEAPTPQSGGGKPTGKPVSCPDVCRAMALSLGAPHPGMWSGTPTGGNAKCPDMGNKFTCVELNRLTPGDCPDCPTKCSCCVPCADTCFIFGQGSQSCPNPGPSYSNPNPNNVQCGAYDDKCYPSRTGDGAKCECGCCKPPPPVLTG